MPLPLWFWITFWTLILILVIVAFILIIASILGRTKKLPDIKRDTFVENYVTKFTHGHSNGYLKQIISHKSGRKIVEFYATDITDEELETKDLPILERIAVEESQIHVVPKGKHSNGHNKMFIVAKQMLDMIDKLPETMKEGFQKNDVLAILRKEIGEYMKAGSKARISLMRELAGGELTREKIIQISEVAEELLKKKQEDLELTDEKH